MVINLKKITEILKIFGFENNISSIEKINTGHINSTYKIIYSQGESYILQRINQDVFKNSEEIMTNIDIICECLKNEINCPEFIKYKNKNYIIKNNEIWRSYKYIANSVSYNELENKNLIFEFGKVVGKFHSLTQKLDTGKFYNVLENFHNTVFILKNLISIYSHEYKTEFDFFKKSLTLAQQLEDKKLLRTVTHNDVKCANVLFDKTTGKGITLIDFDTVMPGLIVHDFGDGVRSACVTENKLDKCKLTAFCNGYFSYMNADNIENYFLGIFCITAELSARYFYDFITNGNYFSDKTTLQKLDRSRELITLAESIIENKANILEIIQDFE